MPIGAAESVIPQCDGSVAPDGITSGHIEPRYGGGKIDRRREAKRLAATCNAWSRATLV